MPSRATLLSLLAAFAPGLLGAQGGAQVWVPPQPPCDIKAGHFRITSAIIDLQAAAQKPTMRDRMLSQAQDVLTRAITGDAQQQNPAAWYYLGRYYVEMRDAMGADSAFRRAQALAPQCQQDIEGYREKLWGDVIQAGLADWQENKLDSAKILLRQAAALRPSNPRALLALGQIYATENKVDSATALLSQGAAAVGNDTTFAEQKKQALGTAVRLYVQRLQADTTVQRWQHTKFTRDSTQRLLIVDSLVLGRVIASSASRKSRGARLAPADQQAFSRDSLARARGVADRRAALAAGAAAVSKDSAAAQPAYTPVISAFKAYLQAYPEATEAVPGLANLYYQSGRVAEAAAALDSIYPPSAKVDPAVIIEAGRGALRGNAVAAGAHLLERGVAQRPYERDALVDLANAYAMLRDSTHLLPTAQQLQAIDPLNRTTLRLLAAGWDLRGRHDSAQKYQRLADGGLPVEITINSLDSDSSGSTLRGVAANGSGAQSPVQRLTFEFLDASGHVQLSQAVEIPPLAPQGTHPIEIHIPAGTRVTSWRYRPS